MSLRLSAALALLTSFFAHHTVRAADEENPFKKAKVGDYAKYTASVKLLGSEEKVLRTQTVTAVNDKELFLKTVVELNGKVVPSKRPERKIDLTQPLDPT